ncbi:hypothetical protein [Acuticoccus sp. I52.16.1]|uniref:hypothetical protein n=1 Tax=Acuticoccus sp. I52.16.1 TaxID=2928472 RepID=UPI001FCF97EC|nr:hypothetical protein [Acuticoccus sp. I52.16.1]UOM34313.1 hypothetical protein MRB58_21205 [Acuticoccus sp. I52.16.1]
MISSIVDVILLAALAGTTGAVLLMYRRLQRFDALQNAAAKEFARSSEALDRAREAMSKLSDEGGQMAITLVDRLNEARVVMNEIDAATLRTRETYVEIAEFERSHPPAPIPAPAAAAPVADVAPAPADLVVDEEDEVSADARRTVPAAIRIRDAARARIAAARQKAVEAQAAAPVAPRAPRPHHELGTAAAAAPTNAAATGAPKPADPAPQAVTRAPRPAPSHAETALASRPKAGSASAVPLPAAKAVRASLAKTEASRPATTTATAAAGSGGAARAAERPKPNGPIMMLVKDREGLAASPAGDETQEHSAEFEAAMAAMNGRQYTWSELATAAAQRSA